MIAPQNSPLSGLSEILTSSPYTFLAPPVELHHGSLALAKHYLDPLAAATSDLQEQRQQTARRKRKRNEQDPLQSNKLLRLKQIYVEGFGIDQIWEQARRALDASRSEIERSLEHALPNGHIRHAKPTGRASYRKPHQGAGVRFSGLSDDDQEAVPSDAANEEGLSDTVSEQDEDAIPDGMESDEENSSFPDEDLNDGEEANDGLDDDSGLLEEDSDIVAESEGVFVPDKNGLNDGFFSLDDFNRQSGFLEQQDARGENDGAASDEEDVDWTLDPMANGQIKASKQSHEDDAEADESDDTTNGPTFGNADLDNDASDSDAASDLSIDDAGGMKDTNNIKYADFFAPPAQKASKKDRRRALPKTQPPPRDDDEGLQRTISAVRRDIFEDDLTASEASDAPASNPDGTTRSSHQKRQAALTAEIRRLEAAAIAKRDWTLSGEARAADRPINSLLEEDLDFERVGKPVPVITQEISEDIEALIKRRILAREFDEVIRRRPGNLATGAGKGSKRGLFELSDAKPEQSLAEVYEAEHLQKTDPTGHPSKATEKLKAEHAKIESLWKEVSSKLDALSSWHYRPKPPSAEVNVVADVPAISMEDARPAAGGDVGGASMLAPQEIYKAGENRDKVAEVLTGSGLPVGRTEMTREEKLRRRRREKERIRKAGGLAPGQGGKAPVGGKKAEEKNKVVKELQKGGVRVIGKKGEIRDVDGRMADMRGQQSRGAGAFKL